MSKANGDTTYLAKACANGKFQGQLPTKTGPQTVPSQPQPSAQLDKARYQSAGTIKSGS